MSYGSATVDQSGTATAQFRVPGQIGNVVCPGDGDAIAVEPGSYELVARIMHTANDAALIPLQVETGAVGTTYRVEYDAEDPCGATDHLTFDGRYWKANDLTAFARTPRINGTGNIAGTFTPQTATREQFVTADGETATLTTITSPGGAC